MKTQSKIASRPWRKVRIEEIFAPLEDGRTMHQGWSPQCEKQPSRSEKAWGVLRTTAIQPGEFQPEHNKLLPSKLEPRPLLEVKPGDILITCAGPRIRCGISCLVENTRGRLMISGKMYRFRTRPEEVLPKYLVAFLQSEDAAIAIDGMKTGGSESGLNLTHERFRQLLVPIGPLAEQQRIVGILDEAFEGIATAKANAEKNLQNARALFESHLHTGYADKAFLGDLVNIKTGKLDANAAVEGGQYPFFTCSRDIFAIDTYAFDCEAILLAGNNAVGDFNVKHYTGKFNAYQRTYVITVNEKKRVLYRFLYFQMLKSLKKFKAQSVGAGTKFLKLGMIKDLEIELPSLDEQERIVSTLDAVREETDGLAAIYERKLAALDDLKKSLLHQAFSGNL